MKSIPQLIISYFKEVSVVVIGVLIAIYLGNLKEELDNRRFVDKTMFALQAEMQGSKADLDSILVRHSLLLDSLGVQFETGNEEPLMQFVGRMGGIQIASTNNIVLRFFISTKADLLDFEMVSKLSQVEFSSNILQVKMDKLIDFSFDHLEDGDSATKLKFAAYLSNVIDSEMTLSAQYAELLEDYAAYFPETDR